jgi:pilus assembly protein Flp/PilA
MKAKFQKFCNDESAVTAIEYGLIAALISIIAIAAMTSTGGFLGTLWTTVSNALSSAAN